jgi:hypothetical protein
MTDPDFLMLKDETDNLRVFSLIHLAQQLRERGYVLKRDEDETYSTGV